MSDALKEFKKSIKQKQGMAGANKKYRTICEVLREINDMHQGAVELDKKVRILLAEAEYMAKRMDAKLLKYNKKYHKKFWKTTDGRVREDVLRRRLSESYLTGEKLFIKELEDR